MRDHVAHVLHFAQFFRALQPSALFRAMEDAGLTISPRFQRHRRQRLVDLIAAAHHQIQLLPADAIQNLRAQPQDLPKSQSFRDHQQVPSIYHLSFILYHFFVVDIIDLETIIYPMRIETHSAGAVGRASPKEAARLLCPVFFTIQTSKFSIPLPLSNEGQ